MVSVRSLTGSLFALALLTLPAKAATLATFTDTSFNSYLTSTSDAAVTGNVPSPVASSEIYSIYVNRVVAAGTIFSDTFVFDYNPTLPSGLSAQNLIISLPGGASAGFSVLNYEWLNPANVATESGSVLLNPSNVSLTLTAIGAYTLHIFGTTSGSLGGAYQAQLVTGSGANQVPVPGAVFLFGSVLAGGLGGMQLMRRRRAAQAA